MLALLVAEPTRPAGADDRLLVPANDTWKTECGACHVPYPPRLLPVRSWRAVMGGLDRHFGTDASLDPKAAAEIAAFLERHAGRDRGSTTVTRITETPWFRREHRKVPAAVWGRADVKSPANCTACHAAAERGDYDEDSVRLPTGETMSLRKILVWDVPTRVFHWLLVISFAGAFLTADSERQRDLHILFGVTMLTLIAFRLVWGVAGTRYARFASFAFGPPAVLHYLRSVATLSAVRYLGHTPAGSWAIWLMLGLGILVGVTGYAAYRDGPEWLEEAHEALAWTLLAVVVVHVVGVGVSSVLHRENLVTAMITGRKRGEASQAIRGSRWLAGAGLAALVLALWLDVVAIPGLDVRRDAASALHASGERAAHEEDD